MRELVSELFWFYFYKYESCTLLKKVQALSPAFSNIPNSLQKSPPILTGKKEKDEGSFIFNIVKPNTRYTTALRRAFTILHH